MERTKWTDDMLDQRFATMDKNFDLLREQMRAGFEGIRAEMAANRAEVIAFHRQIVYVVVTLWVGLLGLFAAQL